jgi:outer membrane protein assembly factor BamA
VQETTRFREFGPVAGSTYSLALEYAPPIAGTLSRLTLDVDARKYFRLTPGMVFATRLRGFRSTGDDPDYFFFGGNMELRGFNYRSLSGTEGFFANAELRFPIIDLMKTPIGIIGPLRGTLFAGMGGARWHDAPFRFGTRQHGRSYINDPVFGEPVSGYRLVDARASFGWGLQLFLVGLPLHFDWSRFTDLKVVSEESRFDFWIGYDF